MTTALITHPDCLNHLTPKGHPERVDRLHAIAAALQDFDLLRLEAPMGEDAHILRAHPQTHIDRIKSAGVGPLDADTHMSEGSLTAAYRGVGAVVKAVDMVMGGEISNTFCAIRPPGHHAECEMPMGFCLFGNVTIAAKHALEVHGLSRVAIMDFDVHHGNGTQDLVWKDARILFASTHQIPLYPGSGAASETGAHGNVLNCPLDPETDGAAFRKVMMDQVLPAIDAFAPELILISSGFDAHMNDPLANLNWVEDDFAWATHQLCDLADKHCEGRVVSTLEGGYDLAGLAASCAAHVKVLMERGK
ncbi:MAG: histone deacetylase family protein [Paracoccaceae bacterium]